MAENRGVLRNAPLVVQDREIGVTQTAVFNRDLNVLGPERCQIDDLPATGRVVYSTFTGLAAVPGSTIVVVFIV
jgi:hypothetical protein